MVWLKLAHTAIFAAASAGILYTLYCGVRGIENRWLYASVALTVGIAACLVLNGCVCPLQTLARRLAGTPDQGVSDIYLPRAVADLIVPVSSPLAVTGIALVAWRAWRRRYPPKR